ncbi:MAG: group 1 truncated hemoglobin [Rhodoferax sp.]|nr:group 1 truncated hemoglobin [Rhodoferax sp.]
MKKANLTSSLLAIALVSSMLTALPVQAQTSSTAPAMQSDQLYKAFGEKAGLTALMDDFMVRLLADPRTGPFFKPSNQQHVKEMLVVQFCMVSGGPCTYKGVDMKTAHANMDITKGDFHALVEVLQVSMDARRIPFSAQNELLAKLAPMHRDVITVK